MSPSVSVDYTPQLRTLMQQVGIANFRQLRQAAGVSEWQVQQLRQGHIAQIRLAPLLQLSQVLQVSLPDLIAQFSSESIPAIAPSADLGDSGEKLAPSVAQPTPWQQEYQRLETQLQQQREQVWQEFQQECLQTLESWLLQWPTAAHAAEQNPQAPAVKLLPLLRPVEKLMQEWGVTAIAPVGTEVKYDPQYHQLLNGTAQAGDPVKVRYAGYLHGGKLLYRAKVVPL